MAQRRLTVCGLALILLLALRVVPSRTALAYGPNITIAQYDALNDCVTSTHWSSGIEEAVKQTLPNEWVDSTSPTEALRAGASIIRQDYWYFHNNNDTWGFCPGVAPYPYDMRDSRMQFHQGSGGPNSARATDDTVTKGWAPYGSGTANDMYLAFRLPLQLDTVTQANALYLWTDIVSDANWPPGEYAPNACCTAPGNIGVVTPLALTCVDDCTADYDADGVVNYYDNCPFAPNPNQANTDANNSSLGLPGYDSYGDACDDNISGDGYTNEMHAAYSKNPADYCALMRADIDGDGSVSTPDLARVGKSFGLTFTHNFFPLSGVDAGVQRRDQNGDNAIGTPDLGFVGKRFGHSVTECP